MRRNFDEVSDSSCDPFDICFDSCMTPAKHCVISLSDLDFDYAVRSASEATPLDFSP